MSWKLRAHEIASECGMLSPPNWFDEFIARLTSEAEQRGYNAGMDRAAYLMKLNHDFHEHVCDDLRSKQGKPGVIEDAVALGIGLHTQLAQNSLKMASMVQRQVKKGDLLNTQNILLEMDKCFVTVEEGGKFLMTGSDHPEIRIGNVQWRNAA